MGYPGVNATWHLSWSKSKCLNRSRNHGSRQVCGTSSHFQDQEWVKQTSNLNMDPQQKMVWESRVRVFTLFLEVWQIFGDLTIYIGHQDLTIYRWETVSLLNPMDLRFQGSRYPALEYGNDATVGLLSWVMGFWGDEDGGCLDSSQNEGQHMEVLAKGFSEKTWSRSFSVFFLLQTQKTSLFARNLHDIVYNHVKMWHICNSQFADGRL